MSKPTRAEREGFAALDALYAELPPIACQGRCAISCRGGIVLTDLEARRLQLATHIKPRTTDARGRCVYLTADDRCSVHPIRPLICRTWGVVKMLSCMHGCVPARWLDDRAWIAVDVSASAAGASYNGARGWPPHLVRVSRASGTTMRDSMISRSRNATHARPAHLHGGRIGRQEKYGVSVHPQWQGDAFCGTRGNITGGQS